MFSSRLLFFAEDLMKATKGRGVDVILNSLTGDMLHESWRCIADNGTFVEIGKKDLLGRNSLLMEPFSWNASYRAFDLSLKCVSTTTMARCVFMPLCFLFESDVRTLRLLSQIFKMVDEGHYQATPYRQEIHFRECCRCISLHARWKYIGKIVLTDDDRDGVQVPVSFIASVNYFVD